MHPDERVFCLWVVAGLLAWFDGIAIMLKVIA